MARRRRTLEVWKAMQPSARRRLALAVFLMFSVLGPLMVLMESELHLVSWRFVVIQSVASGGLAASFVLFAWRRRWMIAPLVVFWSWILLMNSGGLSIVVTEKGNVRTELHGPGNPALKEDRQLERPVTLQPAELNAIYAQRTIVGLAAIFCIIAGYVQFVRFIQKEVRNRARLETEVKIAQDIQQSLLPDSHLTTPWCEIAGTTIPATEVGGDFFDVLQPSPDTCAVCIADVTGHGIGAGILSSMTKSAFRSQLQHDAVPVAVLTNLNRTLVQVSDEKMFVTFAYVWMDAAQRTVRLATAGHPPILHRSSTGVSQLRTPSLALGMREEGTYNECTVTLTPGDRLLLYTDGVVEAANKSGEQFGIERLQQILRTTPGTSNEVGERILADLRAFRKGDTFDDDVSLVCITVTTPV